MPGSLEGKTALVTGGGSGIGRATALAFAREGARVAIVDYVPEGGNQTLNMIKEIGDGRFFKADVSKPDEIRSAVEQTVTAFGRLDCAFNNAGIEGAGVRDDPWDQENWHRVIAINLTGVFLSDAVRSRADAQAGRRRNRQHLLDSGPRGYSRSVRLHRGQTRGRGSHQGGGVDVRAERNPGQRGLSRIHPHPDGRAQCYARIRRPT